MVTDKEGKAVLNNLPIGKYYVVEEKAGQNCVLDPEAKEFEIAYKGQEVAVDLSLIHIYFGIPEPVLLCGRESAGKGVCG